MALPRRLPAWPRALPRGPGLALALVALGLCLFTLVLRASLIATLSVHWDEFHFLEHVHKVVRGEETAAFLAFHGHLFRWLTAFGANEVDQVIAGRWTMFLFVLGHSALLAYLGQRLIGGSAGLFAAFLYGCFSYVLHHGVSFRYDPFIVTLFLGAAALLVNRARPLLTAGLAGFLGALGLVVSLKVVFYLPSLILICALPFLLDEERRLTVRRSVVFGASGILFSGALFVLHLASLASVKQDPGDRAGRIADKAFQLVRPFPRGSELMETLRWDTPMWGLILLGFSLVVGRAYYASGRSRVQLARAAALALPLLTLYFYRNAWPYYYVSILPGASLLAGALWHQAELALPRRPILALIAAALLTVPAARTAWLWYDHNSDEDETAIQRKILAAVHEVFPEPVPYLDRCGMVSSFPGAGPFMSTWTMSAYRADKRDIVENLLQTAQPKMVLANISSLELEHRRRRDGYRWRSRDYAALQDNFVHHWGPIWVAGKKRKVGPDPKQIEVLIGGPYTVEARRPVVIDGQTYAEGAVVELEPGDHRVQSADEHEVAFVLRWGDNLTRPRGRPPRGRLFRGFHSQKPDEKWDLW